MKKKILLLLIAITLGTLSCNKFKPEDAPLNVQINDFIWKGMNLYYLWQDKIPNLADEKFLNEEELFGYLEGFENPGDFFEELKYQPDVTDKWSWIVDDYVALQNYFSGVRKTSGAKIKLYLMSEGSSNVFGVVRYIVPGTDAATKPIERGDVFQSVNGVTLTTSNYKELLYNDVSSFTLDLGTYSYNSTSNEVEITPTGEEVSLNKGEYNENPILVKTVFNVSSHKIGYLMYNSFTSNYDSDLNDAFQYFNNENITDLILDLRYNGGGSVRTSIYLSSMITGQFTGEIFTKEVWNPKLQEYFEEDNPEALLNRFVDEMEDGTSLNSLNLNRVIVITTGNSASASELVINALKPYIDVVTIGETTHGKYVASVTLYDSENFTFDDVNPDHNWAMQPIILKEVNSLGDYAINGFDPNIVIHEYYGNMGVLGTETERLTAKAIEHITGVKASFNDKFSLFNTPQYQVTVPFKFEKEMYVDKELPFIPL